MIATTAIASKMKGERFSSISTTFSALAVDHRMAAGRQVHDGSMAVRWLTAFLDTPARAATAEPFWSAVTGTALSARRGPAGEFASLLPPDGDAFLRVQHVGSGAARTHLDVHVDDLAGMRAHAIALGAGVVADPEGYHVLRSPGGLPFCLVPTSGEAQRPAPVVVAGGARSLVDQVCLDIPPHAFEAETRFWAALTGWERRAASRPEFMVLVPPPGIPLRILLQRLDSPAPAVRAHLDLACADVGAETARHVRLGAELVHRYPHWTTMRDPAGRAYCVTTRDPDTGRLPGT